MFVLIYKQWLGRQLCSLNNKQNSREELRFRFDIASIWHYYGTKSEVSFALVAIGSNKTQSENAKQADVYVKFDLF